jgi:hypothetical protein
LATRQNKENAVSGKRISKKEKRKKKKSQEKSGKVDLITSEKEYPVSCSTIKERCERIRKNLKFNEDEINEVEKTTRGQANNSFLL